MIHSIFSYFLLTPALFYMSIVDVCMMGIVVIVINSPLFATWFLLVQTRRCLSWTFCAGKVQSGILLVLKFVLFFYVRFRNNTDRLQVRFRDLLKQADEQRQQIIRCKSGSGTGRRNQYTNRPRQAKANLLHQTNTAQNQQIEHMKIVKLGRLRERKMEQIYCFTKQYCIAKSLTAVCAGCGWNRVHQELTRTPEVLSAGCRPYCLFQWSLGKWSQS